MKSISFSVYALMYLNSDEVRAMKLAPAAVPVKALAQTSEARKHHHHHLSQAKSFSWNPDMIDDGAWMRPSLAQARSDPICNSSGCTQYLHPEYNPGYPIDYPVADFGLDHDIADSHSSLKIA